MKQLVGLHREARRDFAELYRVSKRDGRKFDWQLKNARKETLSTGKDPATVHSDSDFLSSWSPCTIDSEDEKGNNSNLIDEMEFDSEKKKSTVEDGGTRNDYESHTVFSSLHSLILAVAVDPKKRSLEIESRVKSIDLRNLYVGTGDLNTHVPEAYFLSAKCSISLQRECA